MKSLSLFFTYRLQLITLLFLAIALNVNTLFHEYALDDVVVLTENRFVEEGFKGIPEIISSGYIDGYSEKENVLSGARYRPLSLVLFAVEYQFFGANPLVSHFINILLFSILIALLYRLLEKFIFSGKKKYLAFVTCLVFVVHPVHTEVIANVKSRDELITFILLIISLITFIRYIENKKLLLLITSLFCFLLALFTKESAVTFLGVVPLILYYFFHQSIKKSILFSMPFFILFAGYMLLRYSVVGFNHFMVNDVTNSPYLNATASEALATKIFILVKYIWLLVFPYPLTSDYGYNQVPYIEINSIKFIISFFFILLLIIFAFVTMKRRSIFSFCILYFFVTISVGTNLIIDLGTTMAERMLFQPSLAFCILVAFLFLNVYEFSKRFSVFLLCVILILFSMQTFARNSEWKNNDTLFFADVISSPNSARMNLYVSERYIIKAKNENDESLKKAYLQKAIYYGEKSLSIHSKFAYTYLRLGLAYFYLADYFKAADIWIKANKLEPTDPETLKWIEFLSDVLYKQGNGFSEQGRIDDAIKFYRKSLDLDSNKEESWFNLGENYLMKKDTLNAEFAFKQVMKLDPERRVVY